MRRFAMGLCCCVVGVLLWAVNWLGAAAAVSQVTEWDTQKGRVSAAYAVVGHGPEVIGIIFIVAGLALMIWGYYPIGDEASKASPE